MRIQVAHLNPTISFSIFLLKWQNNSYLRSNAVSMIVDKVKLFFGVWLNEKKSDSPLSFEHMAHLTRWCELFDLWLSLKNLREIATHKL